MDKSSIEEATRNWIRRFVIGFNLCPFAKRPFVQDRIRYVVTPAAETGSLAELLVSEALYLAEVDRELVETTLVIHPHTLLDFMEYNDFLSQADLLVRESGLEGVIQVASFHPDYQFAETTPEAPENYTNRSPYPMLHLLREESIEEALATYPDPENIPARNIATMRRLGIKKIEQLLAGQS